MRIAVYGGSFNPPHIGHVEAAKAAVAALRAEKLIVIPAFAAPLKDPTANSPSAQQRLELVRVAFEEIPGTEISELEIIRGGTSYTVDTLEQIKLRYPEDELFLMLGTDQIEQFHLWRNYRRIMELATLAPFPRRVNELARVNIASNNLRRCYGADITVIELTPTEISSTGLRELLPLRQGRGYCTDGEYAQIIKHRYYAARPELAWLRDKSYAYLDPRRIPHVKGCEQEAVSLAIRWGEDPSVAAEAGILHDITKKLKADDQLKLCEQYDIMTDTDEKANYKLLHSKTGAALSRDLFGISDEVYSAIYWHTTAKPDMTTLEKIIYMADYIEPHRSFDGVEALRTLAYSDLDAAITLGLEMSLEDLARHNAKPHKNSLEALEWLRSQK